MTAGEKEASDKLLLRFNIVSVFIVIILQFCIVAELLEVIKEKSIRNFIITK